jgi:hypothetical protein
MTTSCLTNQCHHFSLLQVWNYYEYYNNKSIYTSTLEDSEMWLLCCVYTTN